MSILTSYKGRTVIYVRVSTKEQLLGRSLETQEQECRKYCEEMGFEVVRVFVERGESAKNDDRTMLQEMLTFCRENKGRITHLIIWKVDRLARNIGDYYSIRSVLTKLGITVHSVTERAMNGDDLSGEVLEVALTMTARIEHRIKSDRAKTNMDAMLASGISPTALGFGYLRPQNKKNGKKKTTPEPPDPERLPIIARGLNEFSTGVHTIASLTKRFRELKLTTPTGQKIYPQMVEKMLVNIKFAGYLTNKSTGEIFKGQHTPAISLETYQKNQLIKAGKSVNAKPRARANPEFPLRDFAKCGECEGTLTAGFSRGRGGAYPYYHCKNRKCARYGKAIRRDDLHNSFFELLQTVTPSDVAFTLFKEIALDVWETKRHEHNFDAERHEKKLAELNAEMRELITMKARLLISEEQFIDQKQPLEEAIIVEKIALNETRIEEWNIEAAISYAVQFMRDLPRQWTDHTLENKQRFQKIVFPEGIIYDKNSGCRTTKVGLIYETLQKISEENVSNFNLVTPRGIEPRLPG